MESDSLYIFPFSAIKFDSKPQYLINIGILNIDTDFFGWICLVFLSYYFFVFCSTKDFYASCRCQENRHCIILVCALNLQDLQGAYTVPILCIEWMKWIHVVFLKKMIVLIEDGKTFIFVVET